MDKNKTLIAYFSHTGITKAAAERIAKTTGGTLFEIKPHKTYPSAYLATVAVAKIEQLKKELPELQTEVKDFEKYDTVLLGFPIWWFTCPQVIKSFAAAYNFNGKTVYPFCTHGGSGPKNSTRDLRSACAGADVKDCFDATSGLTDAAIKKWLGL